MKSVFGALLLSLAACGGSDSASPPADAVPSGGTLAPLTAQDGFFRDPAGRVVFLRGVNYSHRTKTGNPADWQKPEHFDRISSWGFNVVRFLVLWSHVEPEPGVIDAAYLDFVEKAIGWAEERGIYVLVDMHQDLFGAIYGGDGAPAWAAAMPPGPPVEPWYLNYFTPWVLASFEKLWNEADLQNHFIAAWKAVAGRTKTHPGVVGYDLFNEPFPGAELSWTFESGRLTDFYRKVIAALPPGKLVFVEPAAETANDGLPTTLGPGGDVYAPHFYDPLLALGAPYEGGWAAQAAFQVMRAQARKALFVGEFGVNASQMTPLRDQLDALDGVLASWAYWDYNPDPGANSALEKDTFEITDAHLALLRRPYPRALAGIPTRMGFDAGSWRLEWNGAGESVIWLPSPPGAIETDAAWTLDGPLLRLAAGPGPHTLRVSP